MPAPDLDHWLADPVLRTFHRREAGADPRELWRAAGGVRLGDSRRLGRLVRWRIPGLSPETTYREMLRAEPFTVLDEGEGFSLSGLIGRIWTIRRDYPAIDDPDRFRDGSSAGTARVLFAHWVEPAGDGRTALCSETRVDVGGMQARLGFQLVRPLVGRFQHLIGSEPLEIAVRRAERG